MIILTLKIQTSRFLLDRSRASESDLHLVKPSVMEKPALGPLIKLGPTTAAHPVTDKESSTSDPSGRRPNQILRIQSVDESESGSRQQRARGFNSEDEEEEEELKISLRVEGFQPPASTSISRRSESKENLNPRQEDHQHQQQQQQQQKQQHSDPSIQPTGKKAKKFRARNETNEKFLDMEPLPEPPPTPPSRSGDVSNGGGGGGGGSTGSQTRSSSPIPIPRGRRSVEKRAKSFLKVRRQHAALFWYTLYRVPDPDWIRVGIQPILLDSGRIRNPDFVVLDGFYMQYRTGQKSQLL
jgi:hypothetical protein